MQALAASVKTALISLPPHPFDQQELDELVANTLEQAQTKSKISAEIRKNQWEYVLKNEVFELAATEGKALKDPNTKYYDDLRDRLDLVLTFTEHDACEQVFPFNVLYDLLEMQTIASCSHIFSWIEERADRLTEGMVPQKGKALVLLRTLNDLLRRLSKMGGTTMFCGRILTFLSRVFPLGERSGVNLRGEYGPIWEGPGVKEEDGRLQLGQSASEGDKMQVDDAKPDRAESPAIKKTVQREDFYNTFWSLQLPFSRPPLFAEPGTFTAFKEAVNKVLPVIKEATAKERALMGSKAGASGAASLKRKRESEGVEETAGRDYFFAKYLTSPELLELEIADTHFRRQFLFQLLILLNHLLLFTKSAKATWSTPRNRSLQIDFTLDAGDAQWVQETVTKTTEELRQTTPNGRAFAETVHVILEREKNWVRWKNELCAPFDREPWTEEIELEDGRKRKVGMEEATRDVRKKMRVDPEEWPHLLGSAPLTEIWEMGYRDLTDLQHPFQLSYALFKFGCIGVRVLSAESHVFGRPGDVKDFFKKIKQEDARIEMRRKQLAKTAERLAQARAKAASAKDGASSSPHPHPSSTETAAAGAPSRIPTSSSAPLHPSLPAKPGTTTIPASVSLDGAVTTSPSPAPPAASPAPPAAAEPAPALPPDEVISGYEENKQRWAWLALRTARDQYLQHFGKIGTGDIVLLAQEIEKEDKERERAASAQDATSTPTTTLTAGTVGSGDERAASPGGVMVGDKKAGAAGKVAEAQNGSVPPKDPEGDVKMEER